MQGWVCYNRKIMLEFLHYTTERNMPCALQTGAFGLTRMKTVWNNLTDRQ